LPFEPFEYYVEHIQSALDLLEVDQVAADDNNNNSENIATDYDPEKTHDIWEESRNIDDNTLKQFTEKFIKHTQKGSIPNYLDSMISALINSKGALPWNLYLKRLMGSVASHKKKILTRRNRRQPERLDLRGQLRIHKAKLVVALDISGSISDVAFLLAMKEVLNIANAYPHEITIVECDSEIRRVYKVNAVKDIKDRMPIRGGTRFTPVFEYANQHKVNLLVYFTDGKGEDQLLSLPKGYKTLWVISGRENSLSLKEAHGSVKYLDNVKVNDPVVTLNDVIRDGYSMNHQEKIHI
jgi:predicted metal-dependent peptidase